MRAPVPSRFPWPLAVLLDALGVVVFAALGLVSHEGAFSLPGLARVAWPFLVALGAFWLVPFVHRAPASPVRTGLGLWAFVVLVGLALRVLAGATAALPFVLVTAAVLLAILVGWRLVATLLIRLRRRAPRDQPAGSS